MIQQIIALEAGYCRHPAFTVIRGGGWRMAQFPAAVFAFVHRRHGVVLLDTGYTSRFAAATARGAARLYALMTPVTAPDDRSAVAQLKAHGIGPRDVRTVILTHFHADHIAGARDFPAARFVYRDTAYQAVRSLRGLAAVRKAFLPDLLPDDFVARSAPLAAADARPGLLPAGGLGDGYDLLGDGSLIGVDLPGHTHGHMGLYAEGPRGPALYVGDAAWTLANITGNTPPSRLANLIMDDTRAYRRTLTALHEFHQCHPGIKMVPCHCNATLSGLTAAPALSPAGAGAPA